MSDNAPSLGAILLAAGASRRLGQAKQLLELNGQTLVARQAGLLLGLKPACVTIVTGAHSDEVQNALADLPVEIAHNRGWQKGMGRSIATGIAAMPERVRGALIILCDQWQLEHDDLQLLIKNWNENPQSAISAQWGDTSGPPVIFPRSDFARLLRLNSEGGARRVLKRSTGGVIYVNIENAAIDIDTPSDLPPKA
jgi:molybdenum cofactor cytidylyltransferase